MSVAQEFLPGKLPVENRRIIRKISLRRKPRSMSLILLSQNWKTKYVAYRIIIDRKRQNSLLNETCMIKIINGELSKATSFVLQFRVCISISHLYHFTQISQLWKLRRSLKITCCLLSCYTLNVFFYIYQWPQVTVFALVRIQCVKMCCSQLIVMAKFQELEIDALVLIR